MSVSGTPATADINLDEFERRLRAPCDQQGAQLAEFVRIIEILWHQACPFAVAG